MKTLTEVASTAAAKSRMAWNDPLGFGLVFTTVAAVVAILLLAILKLNHGVFTYSLDDPYIHLALSDQIRHGNYGINAGQHAAPSSSILFPFLLAVASGTPIHPYLPLLLNVFALFLTIEIVRRFLVHLDLTQDRVGTALLAAGVFLAVLCMNVIGIVFTGLEHSLHVASVAAVIYGLALFLDKRKMPAWLPGAIIVCPLLRYEGLPLSLAALLVLALRGAWRTAAASFAIIVMLVAGFSVFLVRLGLDPLPGSVLVKSAVVADGVGGHGMLWSVIRNALAMYHDNVGLLLLLAGVVAAATFLLELPSWREGWTSRALMSLVLVSMVVGHALAGRFGWLGRYEVYLLVGTALIGVFLFQDFFRGALATRGRRRLILFFGAAACLVVVGGIPYAGTTALTPLAANNIYEQQFQMHRFVVDFYHGPVAVNDIGEVSYHNPNFVLDLTGLASKDARSELGPNADSATYASFVAKRGIHLVIVYEGWFPNKIPHSWQEVGNLALSRMRVSSAGSNVQFFATDAATAAKLRPELAAFKRTLPPRVRLTIY